MTEWDESAVYSRLCASTSWIEKAWGRVRKFPVTDACHVDELEIKAGGFSSCHAHYGKDNLFLVRSGILAVTCYFDVLDSPQTVSIIRPGDGITVASGKIHRFACLQDCVCVEVYTAGDHYPILDGDISRIDEGGLIPVEELPEYSVWNRGK